MTRSAAAGAAPATSLSDYIRQWDEAQSRRARSRGGAPGAAASVPPATRIGCPLTWETLRAQLDAPEPGPRTHLDCGATAILRLVHDGRARLGPTCVWLCPRCDEYVALDDLGR